MCTHSWGVDNLITGVTAFVGVVVLFGAIVAVVLGAIDLMRILL